MQKIMFNDRYGLTDAVLTGCKTMTRRIVPEGLLVKYSDYDYCVRAVAPSGIPSTRVYEKEFFIRHSRYCVGEEIAIAQKYWDLRNDDAFYEALAKADPSFPLECIEEEKGCNNKMFVKASWMPHRIRITGIRVERLQDISDEDCLREGIKEESSFPHKKSCPFYFDGGKHGWDNHFSTPREAFAALIDTISGKGTWKSNPYVWVYSFELIK